MKKNGKKQEQQFLNKLRFGDDKAVTQWFSLYNKKLLRIVLSKVANPKDADEIVQDTFLNCLKYLPVFRGESSLWTLMQRIAAHEIADYYRKKYAKRVIKTLPLADKLLATPIRDSHETSEKVRLVLGNMSVNTAELLKLKYIDKKKVTDIALQMGKSVKAIESDLFRARAEFKKQWVKAE